MITIKKPSDCTAAEIAQFAYFARKGEEVETDGLIEQIINPAFLGFAHQDAILVGVAAIKRPTPHHTQVVFHNAHSSVPPELFDYELGWLYTRLNYRRRGIGSSLANELLCKINYDSVWATTREKNSDINSILDRMRFTCDGIPFKGRRENLILWIKKGISVHELNRTG